jgi:hypothetical protein
MKIVSPFYIIFNTNNWFYNSDLSSFSYSDDIVTLNTVYLQVPLKNDSCYNEKINKLLKRFITALYENLNKNLTNERTISTNAFSLLENKINPHIIYLKSSYITHNTFYFEFE